jgi:hypothetical protein
MKNIEQYYKRLREAKTIEELKAAYQFFADAFVNDEITIEQYHSLRMCFHNMVILKF